MRLTRRDLIPCLVGARIAFTQNTRSELAVTSPSGLRLERFGDPERPTVALWLPGTGHPAAVIEMPEHAWRKEKASDDPVWFYKMYTSDPSLRGEVTWSREDRALAYRMKTPSGFAMRSKAVLDADGVAITHEIDSPSGRQMAVVQAPTCVKLYQPFTDVFLERTYVHHASGLELIASETPDRLAKNAEEWLPCRYIVRCGKDSIPPEKLVERVDGVTRYFKSRAADTAFIATESSPAGWVAATHGLDCPSLFTNPARTCHHADPEVRFVRNGTATLRLKVYLLKGTLKEVWERVAERDRAGQA
jgi:hypothetical protein